ncbi:MAG: peptidyl-prolyl cis-trans isomerase [Gemmatimonadota bacterium]
MQVVRSFSTKIAAAVMVILMFGFIATFVPWGQITGGGNSSIGTIAGKSVPTKAYLSMVQQAIDQQRNGNTLSAEDVQQVRDYVWDQLVQEAVITGEFKRRGIVASTDEIVDRLQSDPPAALQSAPDFQTDGKFDINKYHRWLQSSVAQPYLPALEQQYAGEVMRSKLFRVVTADVYPSDAEIWQRFRDQHQTAKIDLATLIVADVVPDSLAPVSQPEIEAYYKAHPDDFKRPRTAYLSYIFSPRLTDASDSAAALERAKSLRTEITGGVDFAEVAKRESADTTTASKGGDLGEWTKGAMDPEFDKVAFGLPLKTVSEPVLTQNGYHLIEVTQRNGTKTKGRHILIPIEIQGAHRDRLDAQADSLERVGAEKLDPAALDTAARVLGLKVHSANPTQEGSRVQAGVQLVPDAALWAFQAKVGETGRIIEVPYGYYLFRLDSLHPAGTPPLAQITDAVTYQTRQAKKLVVARQMGQKLIDQVAKGASFAATAESMKIPHHIDGPFTRIAPPVPEPIVVGASFGVDSGKTSALLEGRNGLFVVFGLGRAKPDSAQFVKEFEALRSQVIQLDRQSRVRNYLAALQGAAKIEDRRTLVLQTEAQAEAAQARNTRSSQ